MQTVTVPAVTGFRSVAFIFTIPILVYLVLMGFFEGQILRITGHVLYPIDDPYIHLAIARHLAQHGYFGVSLAGYSATSSAPGWTLLLGGCIAVIGNQEWLPLLLNLLGGLVLLITLTIWLQRWIHNSPLILLWMLIFMLILPLPALTALGMEHVWHIVWIIWLVQRSLTLLQHEVQSGIDIWILIAAFLATAFRYESIFVVIPIAILFFVRRQTLQGLLLAGSSILLVVVIGWLNWQNQYYFLPNSILQKSSAMAFGIGRFQEFINRLFGQLFCTSHLVVPFMLSTVVFFHQMKEKTAFSTAQGITCFILICAAILHCMFASIGWFYRYEAYLLTLALMALATCAPVLHNLWHEVWRMREHRRESLLNRFCLILILCLVPVIFWVNLQSMNKIVPGAWNLYQQQYQMGLFLQKYYPSETIVANDIGAINYLADVYCLDLMGLGSLEPLQARALGRWNEHFIQNWANNRRADIAIIYDSWWNDLIPRQWILIGQWLTDQKVTVADTTVSFYAITPDQADKLWQCLNEYRSQLPDGVETILAERQEQE
ncbi:MAG: hypothetical protein ACOX5R_20400 [bacterium]